MTILTTNLWAVNILDDNMADCETPQEKITYLQDVAEHGCISGCVSGVIYYRETKKLFVDNMDAILETIEEYQEETGINMLEQWDATTLYNSAVWFVVEMVAQAYSDFLSELQQEGEENTCNGEY